MIMAWHDDAERYKKAHPDVLVHLQVENTRRCCAAVARGEVNIAIVGGEIPRELEHLLQVHPTWLLLLCSSNRSSQKPKYKRLSMTLLPGLSWLSSSKMLTYMLHLHGVPVHAGYSAMPSFWHFVNVASFMCR